MSKTAAQSSSPFVLLEETFSEKRQGRLFKKLVKLKVPGSNGQPEDRKLLCSVYADSYDFQSYARVEIYSPTESKWNLLMSLPYANMACKGKSLATTPDLHKKDCAVLLESALKVLL